MSPPTYITNGINRTQTMRFSPYVFFCGKEKGYESGFHYFGAHLQMSQNAFTFNTVQSVPPLVDPTLYASPLITLTKHGYTKHYYAGAERVAARIGGGNLNHDTECIVDDGEAIERSNNLFWQCSDMVNSAVIEHRDLEEMNIVNIDNDEMEAMWKFDMKQVPSMMKAEVIPEPWKILDAIGYFSQPNSIVSQGDDDEPYVYFYHSDHLGSASWITDGDGIPVQHLQYLPYGEPYINQRVSGYSERFTFTGKERDEETGYSYFSARYLDHEILTSFLSVDRYADKYPFISPYAYCAWNPIKLIDPSGDTLIALDRQSQLDIISLAGSYRERVRFNDRGAASIDYSGMSEDEINTMNSDLGVGLIKDISDSPVRILYEATDLVLCTDLDGNKTAGHLNTDRTKICNLSRGGFDSNDGYSGMMPREGYDGQVVISPNAKYYCDGFQVFRTEIIGHELAENYARTAFNCNYNPNNNGDTPMERLGAHQYANQRMQNPHKAYSVRYKPQYNPQYLKMANAYLGY